MKRIPVMTSELRRPLDCGTSHGRSEQRRDRQCAEQRDIAPPEAHQPEVNLLLVAHVLASRDTGRK